MGWPGRAQRLVCGPRLRRRYAKLEEARQISVCALAGAKKSSKVLKRLLWRGPKNQARFEECWGAWGQKASKLFHITTRGHGSNLESADLEI
jgi:hypothetical protein